MKKNYELRITNYDFTEYHSKYLINHPSSILHPQSSNIHHPASSISRLMVLFFIILCNNFAASGQENLTLSSALEIGLKNNLSILLQKNEEQVASNNNTIGNAGFLPVIGLTGTQATTISTTHQEQFSGTIKDVSNGQNNAFNAAAQMDWTLFDGLNMFVNKKMLGTLEDLGENGTRIVVEEIVSEIILTYYGIVQLGKLIQVAQDAVDLSMQRKRIALAKLSLGSGSQLMLLQSTVDLNTDSTSLVRQMNSLANTKADFNRLLAREVTIPYFIHDTITLNVPFQYDSLLQKALSQNSALISSRLNREIARLGVKEAQSELYPKVGLNAGYSFSQINASTGFAQFNRGYGPSFGFNLSYNIFNGFNVLREIKNAKIYLNSGDIEVRDNEQEIHLTLLKLYNDYLSNLEIVRLQLTNVDVAKENVNVAFEKYKLGSINDIELREIQQKLIDANYQLILSTFEAKKAEIGLIRMSGDILKQLKW
jgi:outer membrane protein